MGNIPRNERVYERDVRSLNVGDILLIDNPHTKKKFIIKIVGNEGPTITISWNGKTNRYGRGHLENLIRSGAIVQKLPVDGKLAETLYG